MSLEAIKIFTEYFERFETALESSEGWEQVEAMFTDSATYVVEGVPFACEISGASAIVAGFKKSVENFDRNMSNRGLELLSCDRSGPGSVRLSLLSSYEIEGKGMAVAPVTIDMATSDGKISMLRDIYDPELTGPALLWIATHAEGCDPSYV